MLYLPLDKEADTPFHIQEDDYMNDKHKTSQTVGQHQIIGDFLLLKYHQADVF